MGITRYKGSSLAGRRDTARLRRLEERLRRQTHALRERNKELRCVYAISSICDRPGITLEEMLQKVVERIPASWQYPDISCARLVLREKEFQTPDFARLRHRQRGDIRVRGRRIGFLEVGYLRRRPPAYEGPFLAAERNLLDVITERMGKLIELKQAEEELRSSRERLRDLLRSSEKTREDERRHIAHEIHDELGHALLGMKMDVGWLREECPGRPKCRGRIRSTEGLIDATIRNVRRLASELKPVLLEDFGLPAAVAHLAEDFQRRYGISCRVSMAAGELALPENLAIVLYRSIQELLTNVARHAQADRVVLRLRRTRGSLTLCVHDNGKGLAEGAISRKTSLGLMGIAERVQGHGGTVRFRGSPGRGTRATIRLPLKVQEAAS